MAPYERFVAWQHCHQLTLATYRLTADFPQSELYGLTSQMRRAAFSAAANIVEGSARRGSRQFRLFLDHSIGSLAEVTYAGRVAKDLDFASSGRWQEFDRLCSEAGRTTMGLYRQVARAADRDRRK